MSANRREYYRDYKRRQRKERRRADQCIDCGSSGDLEVVYYGRSRCAECREKALARLRRRHPLPDLSDPKVVNRQLRRALLELQAWDDLPVGPHRENLQAIRSARGRWQGIIRELELQRAGLRLNGRGSKGRR